MKGLVKYMSQIVIIVTIKLKTHCTVGSRNTLYNNKMTKKKPPTTFSIHPDQMKFQKGSQVTQNFPKAVSLYTKSTS